MKSIFSDHQLIAACGLYCGACNKYLNEKCPGCIKNEKASWCKIRICCKDNHYTSCADCLEFSDPNDCKKYNNFISKIFGFVSQSDRAACIKMIKKSGIEQYVNYMVAEGRHSMKKTK